MRGPVMGRDELNVLARLREMFLINSDTRGGTTWYELAHDRLVGPVRMANRAWRYRKLEPWQLQALDWKEHNRPPSLLLPPSQLPYKMGKDSPVEQEFRKACLEHYGSRFRLLRWQMLSVFVAVLALVELVVIVYLGFSR